MAEIDDKIQQFKDDSDLVHDLLHGDVNAVVTTENGDLPSFANLQAQMAPFVLNTTPIENGKMTATRTFTKADIGKTHKFTEQDFDAGNYYGFILPQEADAVGRIRIIWVHDSSTYFPAIKASEHKRWYSYQAVSGGNIVMTFVRKNAESEWEEEFEPAEFGYHHWKGIAPLIDVDASGPGFGYINVPANNGHQRYTNRTPAWWGEVDWDAWEATEILSVPYGFYEVTSTLEVQGPAGMSVVGYIGTTLNTHGHEFQHSDEMQSSTMHLPVYSNSLGGTTNFVPGGFLAGVSAGDDTIHIQSFGFHAKLLGYLGRDYKVTGVGAATNTVTGF